MTFEELQNANSTLSTMDIKGKDYVLVNERVRAFRMLYPEGTITTDILSLENGVVTMKTTVLDDAGKVLATGMAYEKETSSYINKTSFIENCETSAVGRALGFLGIGVDKSIASYEEVQNAINNQDKKEEKPQKNAQYKGNKLTKEEAANLAMELQRANVNIDKLLEQKKVEKLIDLTPEQYIQIMGQLDAVQGQDK